MRLITNKKMAKIGKRLAAILYISIRGYGKGTVHDLDATAHIIDHVYEIAYMVGGFDFATHEIPELLNNLKRCANCALKEGDDE